MMLRHWKLKLTQPLGLVILLGLLLFGQGCAHSSKITATYYTDDKGLACLSPQLLKDVNVEIAKHPKNKIIVSPVDAVKN